MNLKFSAGQHGTANPPLQIRPFLSAESQQRDRPAPHTCIRYKRSHFLSSERSL